MEELFFGYSRLVEDRLEGGFLYRVMPWNRGISAVLMHQDDVAAALSDYSEALAIKNF